MEPDSILLMLDADLLAMRRGEAKTMYNDPCHIQRRCAALVLHVVEREIERRGLE